MGSSPAGCCWLPVEGKTPSLARPSARLMLAVTREVEGVEGVVVVDVVLEPAVIAAAAVVVGEVVVTAESVERYEFESVWQDRTAFVVVIAIAIEPGPADFDSVARSLLLLVAR